MSGNIERTRVPLRIRSSASPPGHGVPGHLTIEGCIPGECDACFVDVPESEIAVAFIVGPFHTDTDYLSHTDSLGRATGCKDGRFTSAGDGPNDDPWIIPVVDGTGHLIRVNPHRGCVRLLIYHLARTGRKSAGRRRCK